jgi:predicted DNA-binding protein (MmcQ/YjbR family)
MSSPAEAHAWLCRTAAALPGAQEDHPWGDLVYKVRGKIFLFLGPPQGPSWGFSVKLPLSHHAALDLPIARPTGYGLGRAGWVSFQLEADALPSEVELLGWLLESYRAIAPRKLCQELDARPWGEGRGA